MQLHAITCKDMQKNVDLQWLAKTCKDCWLAITCKDCWRAITCKDCWHAITCKIVLFGQSLLTASIALAVLQTWKLFCTSFSDKNCKRRAKQIYMQFRAITSCFAMMYKLFTCKEMYGKKWRKGDSKWRQNNGMLNSIQ